MKTWLNWVLVSILCMTTAHLAVAQENEIVFVQVSSHSDLDAAIQAASNYASSFPNTEIYLAQNGYYAVVLGTVARSQAKVIIQGLVSDLIVPNDTFATAGKRFSSLAWQPTSEHEIVPKQHLESPLTVSPSPKQVPSGGTGTGFVVSADGHVLTNAHVVKDCRSISVDGAIALLVETSEMFDLAVLKMKPSSERTIATFSFSPAKLNSDVTVAGYPLAGLLSGLNVTKGSVSSLKGLGGETTQMQITAPVQPGNSGGPVLASDGEVIGVVVSKLNDRKIADATGDIPQYVSFAIRGEIAKLFLFQNGVDPLMGISDEKIDSDLLAEIASNFTVFIECE